MSAPTRSPGCRIHLATRTATRAGTRGAVIAVTGLLVCLVVPACSDDAARPDAGSASTSTSTSTSTAPRTTTSSLAATPGASDAGDPLTPGAGNGGFDVDSYDLELTRPDTGPAITAIVTIAARATQDLSTFDLDLHGLTVDRVTVDNVAATSVRILDELVVTPAAAIANGTTFSTVVAYHGTPATFDNNPELLNLGWTNVGRDTFVLSEPRGGFTFMPSSDHPSDKAVFTFTITAPSSLEVLANGVGTKVADHDGLTTWRYVQSQPMASYLVQIAIGDYDIEASVGPHQLPIRSGFDRDLPEASRPALRRIGEIIEYFEPLIGPYPFDVAGVLVADGPTGFSLETQTLIIMPLQYFSREAPMAPPVATTVLAHELAHQWFGDAITPTSWSDIWLNEGFATYFEWMWQDHDGLRNFANQLEQSVGQTQQLRTQYGPVLSPKPAEIFSPNEYDGAAVVLQALRVEVGDDVFFDLLRDWVAIHRYGNVTTAQFEELASRKAGRDLGPFFDSWLNSTTAPAMPTAHS